MIRPVAINTLRSRLAGVGLFSMIVLSMASVVWSPLLTAAAALTWLCALVLWHRLGTQLKLQFAAVTSVGLLGLVWGVRHDGELDPIALFTQNQLIISMLGAVSMLRLLNPVGAGKTEDLPTGRGAFIKSILGLHCFGALINISALVIMGDRLSRNQPLQPFEAVCISRVFTTAVF